MFFENPNIIAFTPAFEVGKEVGVSESTVIRLTQTLGYKGYSELQEIVQDELKKGRTLFQHMELTSLEKEEDLVKHLMNGDIANIQRTMDIVQNEDIIRAVEMISEAEKIYVTGSLLSYGLAYFLAHGLKTILQNVELVVCHDPQFHIQLAKMNENQLLIPIIFPRYTQDTMSIVNYAKGKGLKVVSITDSELSPVGRFSDIVLTSPINSEIKIDSYTAPLSLITLLMRFVSVKNDQKVEQNLRELEKVYEIKQVFYQE